MERQSHTLIIVITSFMNYLDDAMRFHVFRYLSKPLDRQRLFRNMDDAMYALSQKNAKQTVRTRQGTFVIYQKDVILIEVIKRHLFIHTIQKEYETLEDIKKLEEKLSPDLFFSPHKNCLINFQYVISFDHQSIHLIDNITVDLVRRKYQEFKSRYLRYLEKEI